MGERQMSSPENLREGSAAASVFWRNKSTLKRTAKEMIFQTYNELCWLFTCCLFI
jgi:hypothetical protein